MDWITQVCLPLAAILVTFGVGLGVTIGQIRSTFRRPRPLVLGVALHSIALPALAYLAASTTGGDESTVLGLMILAASPSNVASPLLTRLARGDVALSLTLTALTCVLAALVMPLVIQIALLSIPHVSAPLAFSLVRMMGGLFLVTTLPAIAGMAFRRRWPEAAERIERRFPALATTLLLVLIAVITYHDWPRVRESVTLAGVSAVTFNLYAAAGGLAFTSLLRLPADQRAALTLGLAMRHIATAAFVSVTLLNRPELVLPAFAYGLSMWLIGSGVVLLFTCSFRIVIPARAR
jgi:BASS family bile acid:Na+ symporter